MILRKALITFLDGNPVVEKGNPVVEIGNPAIEKGNPVVEMHYLRFLRSIQSSKCSILLLRWAIQSLKRAIQLLRCIILDFYVQSSHRNAQACC